MDNLSSACQNTHWLMAFFRWDKECVRNNMTTLQNLPFSNLLYNSIKMCQTIVEVNLYVLSVSTVPFYNIYACVRQIQPENVAHYVSSKNWQSPNDHADVIKCDIIFDMCKLMWCLQHNLMIPATLSNVCNIIFDDVCNIMWCLQHNLMSAT